MSNLLSFYNLLFGIEITVFGIISAVILVFIQLVYSNYSYRHISDLLKNKWIVIYTSLSFVDLAATSLASFLLSIGQHDFFKRINFNIDNIVVNNYFTAACLVLLFISIAFFFILILKNIPYLQPSKAILLLSKSIKVSNLKNFLWKKYPLDAPFNIKFNILTSISGEKEKKDVKNSKVEENKRKKKLDKIDKEIEKINKRVKNSEDPLLPLRDLIIQFIKRFDLNTLTRAKEVMLSLSRDFLADVYTKKDPEEWRPEADLPKNFTKYLVSLLETLIEVATKENLESAKKILFELSLDYCILLIEFQFSRDAELILGLWQKHADLSIGSSSTIFQEIISHYKKTADTLLVKINYSKESRAEGPEVVLLDAVFRQLGWLGERLLSKLPIEETPLIRNYDYSTDFNTLFYSIISIGDAYKDRQPNLYPLIYFDALDVIFIKLLDIYGPSTESKLDRIIFDIAYAVSSFGMRALEADNQDGAALSALRLHEFFEKTRSKGLSKNYKEILTLLIELGIEAKGKRSANTKQVFLDKEMDEWVVDKVAQSGYKHLDPIIQECYTQSISHNSKGCWDFIVSLGSRMNTNFGFNFDSSTGLIYSDNDPRRR